MVSLVPNISTFRSLLLHRNASKFIIMCPCISMHPFRETFFLLFFFPSFFLLVIFVVDTIDSKIQPAFKKEKKSRKYYPDFFLHWDKVAIVLSPSSCFKATRARVDKTTRTHEHAPMRVCYVYNTNQTILTSYNFLVVLDLKEGKN